MRKLYLVKVKIEDYEPITMGIYTSLKQAKAYEKCYRYTIADCETWVEEKEG